MEKLLVNELLKLFGGAAGLMGISILFLFYKMRIIQKQCDLQQMELERRINKDEVDFRFDSLKELIDTRFKSLENEIKRLCQAVSKK